MDAEARSHFNTAVYSIMSLGFWQIAIIVLIALVIFGSGRLPGVMRDLAKGMRSFKETLLEKEPRRKGSPKPRPSTPARTPPRGAAKRAKTTPSKKR